MKKSLSVRSKLNKSALIDLDVFDDILYKSNKTIVTFYYNDKIVNLFTSEYVKYQFYYYALKKKIRCIPVIHHLIADDKNCLYFIQREYLYPVVETNKLNTIKKIEYWIRNRISNKHPIADTLLRFYYLNGENLDFDFGPHWIMQTRNGKLVVTDAFRDRSEVVKHVSTEF